MDKHYQAKQLEQRIYSHWQQQGYFKPQGLGAMYTIVIPPPNVTGRLHMGHGFQHTIIDALIRYQRMQGYNVLWQVGTDHAGIATQMVVENHLGQQGLSRHQIGRQAFINHAYDWQKQYGSNIINQMRRLGSSIDWDRHHFTMDDHFNQVVGDVFVKLYRDGLIYRGKRLVNWDPHFKTAISNLEVVTEEEPGTLWYIRYPLANGDAKQYVIVATTRPETLFGDVAVACHPADERYQHLLGQQLKVPLTDRLIPIIADDMVDQDFATGCVKITPAHDFNDHEVGRRHQLPLIDIFTDSAHLNDQVPNAYQGLSRFEARKKLVAELEAKGLLGESKDHLLSVPRNDRGHHIIEPRLTDQWFVSVADLAFEAMKVVKEGKINFIPKRWQKTYFQWLENIDDWCISRQLWWGHRIPAFYDDQGKVYVGKNRDEVITHYQLSPDISLTQDEDVLDTWFSSSLWPFASLDWPKADAIFHHRYPTDVLVTGFDIIFFWVTRMIMMGVKLTGRIPFKDLYITGLIRDHQGQKMSKTKGNVLDPIDLMDGISLDELLDKRTANLIQQSVKDEISKQTKQQFPEGIKAYGADALRFTYLILANTGRDIRFDTQRLNGYRNFCNKLWQASCYVLAQVEKTHFSYQREDHDNLAPSLTITDRWIRSKLHQVIDKAHDYFANYRFDLLAQLLYDFVWHEYCDWYIELSKPLLLTEDGKIKQGIVQTLVIVLETMLRLLHPLIPFITEELWQHIRPLLPDYQQGSTIMLASFPKCDSIYFDPTAVVEMDWLKAIVMAVRQIRGEIGVAPNQKIPLLLFKGIESDRQRVASHQLCLQKLAKLTDISWAKREMDNAATTVVGDLVLFIPLTEALDIDQELNRLAKVIRKEQLEIERLAKKLSNQNFLAKAPKAVIADHKKRLEKSQQTISQLKERQAKLNRRDR